MGSWVSNHTLCYLVYSDVIGLLARTLQFPPNKNGEEMQVRITITPGCTNGCVILLNLPRTGTQKSET